VSKQSVHFNGAVKKPRLFITHFCPTPCVPLPPSAGPFPRRATVTPRLTSFETPRRLGAFYERKPLRHSWRCGRNFRRSHLSKLLLGSADIAIASAVTPHPPAGGSHGWSMCRSNRILNIVLTIRIVSGATKTIYGYILDT
jgi:hypothetical protein